MESPHLSIKLKTDPEVKNIFNRYPPEVYNKIIALRQLIIESANELDEISEVEETLKWNEPSYITKSGSTIRIDWKEKAPDQYAIYFKCTSKLVPAFRRTFKSKFNFEGNRAIIFKMDQAVPKEELKRCIKAGLMYHKVKHLKDLGLK